MNNTPDIVRRNHETSPYKSLSSRVPSFTEFLKGSAHPPTPEQEAVIRAHDPAMLVVAGAGSGKTQTMSYRIAWHISQGNVSPNQVLGLTFTTKAARELAYKVNKELSRLYANNLVPTEQNGSEYMSPGFERPTISTYNSFASEIAASYGLLIGKNPRSRLIQDAERWQIMDRLVDEYARENPSTDSVLFQTARSTIVKVALALAASIIDNAVSPDLVDEYIQHEIAALEAMEGARVLEAPFTKKYKGGIYRGAEMSKGFDEAKKTLKNLRLRQAVVPLVRRYQAFKTEKDLVEFADQVASAREIIMRNSHVAQELRSRYSLILLDEYQDTSANQELFLKAAFADRIPTDSTQLPSQALSENNSCRTGVMSVCAVGDPNQAIYGWRGAGANALADFARDFKVPDESRFTLSMAFRNSTNILAAANALTADTSHIDAAKELTAAYPQANLLDRPWLNEIETLNRKRRERSRVPVPVLQPRPKAEQGKVIHVHRHLGEQAAAAIVDHIACAFRQARKHYDDYCRELSGTKGTPQPYQAPTAAVLVRKRSYAQPVIDALEERGIPYTYVGGDTFITSREIVLLRALLGVAFMPSRSDLLLHVLNFYALGAADLRALGDLRGAISSQREGITVSLVEVLGYVAAHNDNASIRNTFTEAGWARLIRVAHAAESLRSGVHLPLATLVRLAIDHLDLFTYAHMRLSGGAQVKRALDKLLQLASDFDKGASELADPGELTVVAFLRWLDAVVDHERGGNDDSSRDAIMLGTDEDIEPEAGIVQILTVHSAKGLEWDIVAVPEMVEGQFDAIEPGKVQPWQKDAEEFPWPLRADAEHVPQLEFQSILPSEFIITSPTGITAHASGTHVAEAGSRMWIYTHGALADYQSQENRRLAYVALTRARSLLLIGTYDYQHRIQAASMYSKMQEVKKNAAKKSSKNKSSGWKAPLHSKFLHIITTGAPPGTLIEDLGDWHELHSESEFEHWAEKEFAERNEELCPLTKLERAEKAVDCAREANTLACAREANTATVNTATEDVILWPAMVNRNLDNNNHDPSELNTVAEEMLDSWNKTVTIVVNEHESKKHAGNASAPLRVDYDHLTASDVVAMVSDPDSFTKAKVRPIPVEPSLAAQRGTAVHRKIAHFFERPATFDVDSLAEPDAMPIDMDEQLSEKRALELVQRARISRFANFPVLGIEESIDTAIGGIPIRCVIDAVFDSRSQFSEHAVTIVDWKTGRRPSSEQLYSRNLQLALYRLAWAKAHNVDCANVQAVFYYLGEDKEDRRELQSTPMTEEEILHAIRMLTPLV